MHLVITDHLWMLAESLNQCSKILNTVNDGIFKRKCFRFWEIIFHLKSIGTEKNIWTSVFYRYEQIYIYRKARISKHYWNKIMQLLWTFVTYLLNCKNVEHGIEHNVLIVLMEFPYIRIPVDFTVDLMNTLKLM